MRTVIGLLIVVLVIIAALIFVRKDPNFLANFKGKISGRTATKSADSGRAQGSNADGGSLLTVPSKQTACSAEVLSKNCSLVPQETVCGYERVRLSDGSETIVKREYISSCHYCKLFGAGGVMNLGDEQIYSEGYAAGSCSEQ